MPSVLRIIVLIFIFVAAVPAGFGFGTVNKLGQNNEHERITRRAFAVENNPSDPEYIFESETLNLLAGEVNGSFGGVGTPDNPLYGLFFQGMAHCDGADFFDTPGYPHGQADAVNAIKACQTWIQQNFHAAVKAANSLVDKNLKVRAKDASTNESFCISRDTSKASAKCAVLTHFGILLHAVQDFYSHSNWTDTADKSKKLSTANPPGLGNAKPAPFLAMPDPKGSIPAQIISGCFSLLELRSPELACNYSQVVNGEEIEQARVKHHYLNKDKGKVDVPAMAAYESFDAGGKIGTGTTPRGLINNNFGKAVDVAIQDSRRKLREFRAALLDAYGPKRGSVIFCVITHDDPVADCGPSDRHLVLKLDKSRFSGAHTLIFYANGVALSEIAVTSTTEQIRVKIPDEIDYVYVIKIAFPMEQYPLFSDKSTGGFVILERSMTEPPPHFKSVELIVAREKVKKKLDKGEANGAQRPGYSGWSWHVIFEGPIRPGIDDEKLPDVVGNLSGDDEEDDFGQNE